MLLARPPLCDRNVHLRSSRQWRGLARCISSSGSERSRVLVLLRTTPDERGRRERDAGTSGLGVPSPVTRPIAISSTIQWSLRAIGCCILDLRQDLILALRIRRHVTLWSAGGRRKTEALENSPWKLPSLSRLIVVRNVNFVSFSSSLENKRMHIPLSKFQSYT